MKPSILFPVAAALLLGFAGGLRSQGVAGKSPKAAIESIKASNEAMIKRQGETLERLRVLEEEARQIKTFSKRG